MSVPIRISIITEGKTRLVVPEQQSPTKFPSFFNPMGKFVRNVSMVCYAGFTLLDKRSGLVFSDSLAGSGARGIRVANEVDSFSKIILNDISTTSIDLAKKSAVLNNVVEKCRFSRSEVNAFLSVREENDGERFDAVDLDPFGTPSPFVDSALRSIKDGGLLSVSATDSGVLCGVYPKVAQRKYLGLPLRTEYSHEVGMRLLFGLLSMTAMRLELSIEPLFCHHDMHYFRTYSRVKVGNSGSRKNEQSVGFILHCFKCGYRSIHSQQEMLSPSGNATNQFRELKRCASCHGDLRVGGPMWIGKIQSSLFIDQCAKLSDMPVFEQELDIPTYYVLTELTDKMGIRTPRIIDVISGLRSIGRSASRTRLHPVAVRTDAPIAEIQSVLKELVL
ncbi:MAG: tRNA (guanine(10)-N(2))-dimethyltransferase [Nitrososphaerota archaeon]|nr:tRNA (guanine(10)-N(2))-dimethyltransferase [Nitrososphaerota archaeon]